MGTVLKAPYRPCFAVEVAWAFRYLDCLRDYVGMVAAVLSVASVLSNSGPYIRP